MVNPASENSWVCARCGKVSPHELAECPHCSDTGGMIRLTSSAVTALWENTPSNGEPDSIPKSAPFFGRFRDLEFLGKGGMGRVYKAFDPTLDRMVALKFLHGEDPEMRRRLLVEARAQAKLGHENVCKVYEVGEEEGKLYIAMQYIRGRTLREAAPEMSMPQKIKIIIRVAQAVHEAHRAGLIHRDLKPANIMVEQNVDGEWIPYVMDFGLARVQDTTGMTLSGMVMGSPHYMSPEQARGETQKLDRRSDVYSLGVCLYEVLSGKRPFEDESNVQVLVKVIHYDPTPLRKRDSSIPVDLETIAMKCLEKAPERRYESSKALAEDLQKYMDGDPIAARAAGPVYRLYKKALKNKTLSAVIAVSVLLVLIAGAAAVRTQWQSRQQALVAHRLGLEVQEMESTLRNAHTMPLHNISRERGLVLQRMREIQAQSGDTDSAGYGPCHYALGYGYLALQEYDRAKEHLELAWHSGFREPTVAYALGQVLGALYDRELERIQFLGDTKANRLKEIQKMYRDPALQYLEMSRGMHGESPSYVEGLIAFYDGRYDEALRKAEKTVQEIPWLYEAKDLQGDAYVLMGTNHDVAGDYEKAAADYDRAGQAYAAAIDMARSDPSLYVSDCAHWDLMMELNLERGSPLEESFQQAVISCDHALAAYPESSEALDKKAWAYWRWGEYQNLHGEDPTQTLTTAIDLGEKSVRINPNSVDAWMRLGAAYNTLGEYQGERGLDPRAMLNKAIAASRSMIHIYANYPYAYNVQAYAAITIAEYEMKIGLDPRPSLNLAIGGFQKTTQFDPKFSKGFNNLAYTYMTRGIFEMNHGMDAAPSMDKAIDGFQQAIRVNPSYAGAFSNLALARIRKAEFEWHRGKIPSQLLEQSYEASHTSLKLNDQSAFAYNVLGFSYLLSARVAVSQNRDPVPDFDQAMQTLKAALRIKPDSENVLSNIIRLCVAQGTYRMEQKENPAEMLRSARTALAQLKKINAEAASVRETEADLLEAKWDAAGGRSPLTLLDRASQSLKLALQTNVKDAESYELLAELFQQKAQWQIKNGIAAEDTIREGREAADQALKINPQMAEAHAQRGLLLLLRAQSSSGNQKDAQDAMSALTTALQINRNLEYLYSSTLQSLRHK
jgi:serine/threonine-protein kinase